jgi:hypothetical protein
MAPSKPIAPPPRFLLPRLTWNGTPRLTTTALPATTTTTRPQVDKRVDRLFGLQRRKIHNIVVESGRGSLGPSLVSKQPRRPSAPTSTTTTTTTTKCSNPVRHNGVYVATFKPARRAFHASAVMRRTHHFDTLKFVQRLRNEGFREEQSVALMKVLNDVIQESIQNLTRTMVLKEGMPT